MLYEYRCSKCGGQDERYLPIDERRTNAPLCCGERMDIIITTAPYGYVDRVIDYICPVTNQRVTSKRQRRNIMAREGLVSAHEVMSSREEREKKQRKVEEMREKRFGPKDLQEQVDNWARRQIA